MIDGRNLGVLQCGIVADPELVGQNSTILKLRLAADWAGHDSSDPDNKTGYFDGVMFLDDSRSSNFARNLKKGDQVIVAYSLRQDRWSSDQGNRSRVQLIIESVNYAGGGSRSNDSEKSDTASPEPQATRAPAKF